MFTFIGCGPSSSNTILPTNTPLPPTYTLPRDTPTIVPTPTNTSIPFGTFNGCIYYEGELVDGKIEFKNTNSGYENNTTKVGSSGCMTTKLAPGYYEISASYWQGPCATMSGCQVDLVSVEIEPNDLVEMNFEIFQVDE